MADEEKSAPVMVTEDLGTEHAEPIGVEEKLAGPAPSPDDQAVDLTPGPAAPPDNTGAPPVDAAHTESSAAPEGDGDAASAQKSAEAADQPALSSDAAGEPEVRDLSKESPPDTTDELPADVAEAFVEPAPPPRHMIRVPRASIEQSGYEFFAPPGATVVSTALEADHLVLFVEGDSPDKRCIIEDERDEQYGPVRRIRWV